jgi:pyridinium-3,5-bisthiocarboxylic acid mononucleotide nickel chelatase
MKTLYFDCFSGAAGDMLLGALLDVDADLAFVRDQLERLEFSGWQLDVVPVTRAGIRATQARVEVDPDQPARDYPEIRRLLKSSELHPDVRAIAERVFEALARAEARVHGVELDRVHLHEVAAVDAFVDIVGTAAALVSLRAERIVASPLPLGGGTTRSAHGPLPVPPPAVAELLAGVPVRGGGDRELVTPTGAAILVTVADSFGDLPPMRLERTGYGAGSADLATPNVVRVIVGESVERHERTALLIETNIDDMPPELVPRVLERLIGAGAHDAWTTSILMKKGRPALAISCLAPDHERDRILDVLYAETTTFGVRMLPVTKDELERAWIEVEVEGHPVRVKQGIRGGSVVTQSPEYEDAVKVANATGLPLKDVYRLATQAAARRAGAR